MQTVDLDAPVVAQRQASAVLPLERQHGARPHPAPQLDVSDAVRVVDLELDLPRAGVAHRARPDASVERPLGKVGPISRQSARRPGMVSQAGMTSSPSSSRLA